MKHQPLSISETRAEAFSASALGFVCWLFGLMVSFGFRGRSRKLQDLLRHAERTVERTLFVHAVARLGPIPYRRQRPASAPRGFRVALSRGQLFYKRANIRARKANIVERVFALLEALQHPEHAIAYFLKRIRKGLRGRRLIIAASIAVAFLSALRPLRPAALDSS